MNGDGKSEDGGYDADGKGAVDAGPPGAMGAIVADEHEEEDAEDQLDDAADVEDLGAAEKRHICCAAGSTTVAHERCQAQEEQRGRVGLSQKMKWETGKKRGFVAYRMR